MMLGDWLMEFLMVGRFCLVALLAVSASKGCGSWGDKL